MAGDWLTIAVVAERGKVKYSQAPVGLGRDDKIGQDDDHDETVVDELDIPLDGPATKNAQGGPRPQRAKEEPRRTSGKKYVNMKLVDFGCRTARGSATGGQAVIRGDASLSLLLFESDGFDVITRENGKKEKVYRGGSRGAFEKMSMLREGAVVALLNPKILKPFQVHPASLTERRTRTNRPAYHSALATPRIRPTTSSRSRPSPPSPSR